VDLECVPSGGQSLAESCYPEAGGRKWCEAGTGAVWLRRSAGTSDSRIQVRLSERSVAVRISIGRNEQGKAFPD